MVNVLHLETMHTNTIDVDKHHVLFGLRDFVIEASRGTGVRIVHVRLARQRVKDERSECQLRIFAFLLSTEQQKHLALVLNCFDESIELLVVEVQLVAFENLDPLARCCVLLASNLLESSCKIGKHCFVKQRAREV